MEQWLSVEECPPPKGKLVKTINKNGVIAVCRTCGNGWYLQMWGKVGGIIISPRNYPTHWMPLTEEEEDTYGT